MFERNRSEIDRLGESAKDHHALLLPPNGKFGQRALPAPDIDRGDLEQYGVARQMPLEVLLARIWEDVLGVEHVGTQDNYFALGGDSLLAVKLFDRVAKATGQSLPLATLFECPTIMHLANALRERTWSPTWKSLVPVQPHGLRPPLFLVPGSAGSVLRFTELAKQLGQDQPVYGLEPLGHHDRQPPLDRVEDMATLYLKEIRAFQPIGPYLLGGRCFGGLVAWEMAQQLSEQEADVALVALLDPGAPEHGPTWSRSRNPIKHYGERVLYRWASSQFWRAAFNTVVQRSKRIRSCWHATGRRQVRMLDAHRKAQKSYVGRPIACRLVLIQSEENWDLRWICERWAKLATGQFEHIVVPGTTHLSLLLGQRFAPTLARHLREHLDLAVSERVAEGGSADAWVNRKGPLGA